MEYSHYYLVTIQYLGFRFNGWQRQPGMKTIESMLLKTLRFILPGRHFKILGAGRTDAKVSSLEGAFEIFLDGDPIEDLTDFINDFNNNLPADIKILKAKKVNKKFNIINDVLEKRYVYLFSFGEKNHPYSAPYIACIPEKLDLELMKAGASLFEGKHNFEVYTAKSTAHGSYERSISRCEIMKNDLLTANFFPEHSYALFVSGGGFLRYQVRMIMGALIQLGKNELTLDEIRNSLLVGSNLQLNYIAPGSGLMLHSLDFRKPV